MNENLETLRPTDSISSSPVKIAYNPFVKGGDDTRILHLQKFQFYHTWLTASQSGQMKTLSSQVTDFHDWFQTALNVNAQRVKEN